VRFLTTRLALLVAILALPATSAYADPAVPAEASNNQNVFIMGGPFSKDFFGDTIAFWDNRYEDNFFGGVGYQYFFYNHPRGLKFGVEAGAGLRLGQRASAEVWAGGVARVNFDIGDITIAPALTAGISVVTDLIGAEAERAAEAGYSSLPVLFYLGPEVSLSHKAMPNLELLARVQHRSGGFGTIAPVDGSNAAVVGLRYKF
jgi:hypothetical protein